MKLLEQLAATCRTMNFAKSTKECYSAWVEDYLRFHRKRAGEWVHPDRLREEAVEAFLTHLAVERNLAASSQSQPKCATPFTSGPCTQAGPISRSPMVRAIPRLFG